MSVKKASPGKPRKLSLPLDRGKVEILSHVRSFLRQNRAHGYVVGGFLRDMLLGKPSKDLDLVVSKVEPAGLALHLHTHLGLSRPVVFPRFKTALTVGKGVRHIRQPSPDC